MNWFFREIAHFLATGSELPPPQPAELRDLLLGHLVEHYAFYGEHTGVRTARKHVGWYLAGMAGWQALRPAFNALERPEEQLTMLRGFFETVSPAPTAHRAADSLEIA